MKEVPCTTVTMMIPRATLARIETYRNQLREATSLEISSQHVARLLIEVALDAMEIPSVPVVSTSRSPTPPSSDSTRSRD